MYHVKDILTLCFLPRSLLTPVMGKTLSVLQFSLIPPFFWGLDQTICKEKTDLAKARIVCYD